jgi:hypothetical protein
MYLYYYYFLSPSSLSFFSCFLLVVPLILLNQKTLIDMLKPTTGLSKASILKFTEEYGAIVAI